VNVGRRGHAYINITHSTACIAAVGHGEGSRSGARLEPSPVASTPDLERLDLFRVESNPSCAGNLRANGRAKGSPLIPKPRHRFFIPGIFSSSFFSRPLERSGAAASPPHYRCLILLFKFSAGVLVFFGRLT
jgi:hypothetical protein